MWCPSCGTKNDHGGRFCIHCGTQIAAASESADTIAAEVGRATLPQVIEPPSYDRFANSLGGRTIDGKYRLDAVLGSGGMGVVYRSTRLPIGDSVALKVLHPEQRADPQLAERFRREARAAARLKHPNAVGIYDFGVSSDGLTYLVMELVEGQSLRQIISQQGPLTIAAAAEVILQVCAALDEAHRQNIVHRDIKPDNIMLNTTRGGLYVKVLDFGIAKLGESTTSNITQTGTIMGTPRYMSPEQCLGEELDNRSDIYSLGIVLYEVLCGVVPFNSPTPGALVVQQVTQPPTPPRSVNMSIPSAVEKVVLHALEKRRDARPQTAGAFAEEMRNAVYGSGAGPRTAVPVATNVAQVTEPLPAATASATTPALAASTPVSGSRVITSRDTPQFQYDPLTTMRSRKLWPLVIGLAFLLLAGLGAAGFVGLILWNRSDSGQQKQAQQKPSVNAQPTRNNQSTIPSPSPEPRTPTTDSADREFKTLSDRRTHAMPDQRSELDAAFRAAELKYPGDYRFTFERARFFTAGQGHHEAFSLLFQAGQKAIDSDKADEMLNSLMANRDGDFSKLSKGHDEWRSLEEALRHKDKSKISAKPHH